MNLCRKRKSLGCFATWVRVRCLTTQRTCLAKKISNKTSLHMLSPKVLPILDKFPALKTKKDASDGIYILHDHIADVIIGHLGTNLTDGNVTIIEASPGPAVLTKALLKAGVTKLKVIEPKNEYLGGLYEIQNSVSPERLQVIKADFFNLSKIAYSDKHGTTSIVEKIFEGISVKSWYDSTPPCVIIGTLPPARDSIFLHYLSAALMEMNIMYNLGRVQLLLFMSEKRLKFMTAKPGDNLQIYRSHSVLSQIFFHIELLHIEERSNFYPHGRNISSRFKFDQEHLYLVKITPKDTLMSLLSSPEALQELYFFVKQNCFKRTDFVISKLESWIPNCGVRLIKNGFSIFTQFGDLSPSQFLHLYMQFASLPEYPDSSFRLALLKSRQEFDALIDDNNDAII